MLTNHNKLLEHSEINTAQISQIKLENNNKLELKNLCSDINLSYATFFDEKNFAYGKILCLIFNERDMEISFFKIYICKIYFYIVCSFCFDIPSVVQLSIRFK